MIPEFVGRLPVITHVNNLDEDALVDILTQPKNAYVKQYQKFFEFDGSSSSSPMRRCGRSPSRATQRGTAPRGLRAIMESLVERDVRTPVREDVTKCLVDRDVVLTGVNPTLVSRETKKQPRGERNSAPPDAPSRRRRSNLLRC